MLSENERARLEAQRAELQGRRDPQHPGHGAVAHPWPDGSERWGDARGESAVMGRLFGIKWSLERASTDLDQPQDWAAGWEPAPDITAEVQAARTAIAAAAAKVQAAIERRRHVS